MTIPESVLALLTDTERAAMSSGYDGAFLHRYGSPGFELALTVHRSNTLVHEVPYARNNERITRPFKVYEGKFRRSLKAIVWIRVFSASVRTPTIYPRRIGLTQFSSDTWYVRKVDLSRILRKLKSVRAPKITRSSNNAFTPSVGRPSPEEIWTVRPWYNKQEYFSVPTNDEGTHDVRVYYREYTSVSTPGFYTYITRKLPINPHHMFSEKTIDGGYDEWEVIPSNGNYKKIYHSAYKVRLGTSGDGIGYSPEHDLSRRNNAISKLASRTNGGVQNIAESASTVGQLTRLITNNFLKIVRSMRALRRGNFDAAVSFLWHPQKTRRPYRNVPSATRSLADNWLELQYGWKPLLQDIEHGIEAVSRFNAEDWAIQSVKATTKAMSKSRNRLEKGGKSGTITTGTQVFSKETHITFELKYGLASPLIALLSQSGFLNPISLAWELIPFSFVVDWAIPIGPYLESLSYWKGLEFVEGRETRFTRYHTAILQEWEDLYQADDLYGAKGFYEHFGVRLDRLKITSFPQMEPPVFKDPFSVSHSLNALALLKSVFSGGPRALYKRKRIVRGIVNQRRL